LAHSSFPEETNLNERQLTIIIVSFILRQRNMPRSVLFWQASAGKLIFEEGDRARGASWGSLIGDYDVIFKSLTGQYEYRFQSALLGNPRISTNRQERLSGKPLENIFWPKGEAIDGSYRFEVAATWTSKPPRRWQHWQFCIPALQHG